MKLISYILFLITIIIFTNCSNDSCMSEGIAISVSEDYTLAGNGDTIHYEVTMSGSGVLEKLTIETNIDSDTTTVFTDIFGNLFTYDWYYIVPETGVTDGDSIEIKFTILHSDYKPECVGPTAEKIAIIECLNPPAK